MKLKKHCQNEKEHQNLTTIIGAHIATSAPTLLFTETEETHLLYT